MAEGTGSDATPPPAAFSDSSWTSWLEFFDRLNWADWTAIVISAVSIAFSFLAFRKSQKFDETSGVASIFLSLRSHYGDFYARLHAGIDDLQYWDEVTLPKSWARTQKNKDYLLRNIG